MFTSRVMAFKMSEMANFIYFLLITVWAISLCTSGRSHRVLAENGMFNSFAGRNINKKKLNKKKKNVSQQRTSEILYF